MLRLIFSILTTQLWSSVQSIQLPKPKGPLKIGTVTFELTDDSRLDPFAPTPQNRSVEISLHYPISHGDNLPFSTYLPRLTAQVIEMGFGIPAGTLQNISTHAHLNATILNGGRTTPVVLFSPGSGMSRLEYTTLVQDLASEGYVVVSIDHPYDAIIVEMSDGSVVTGNISNTPEATDLSVAVRAADARFVLNELTNGRNIGVSGLHTGLDTSRVGFFGHSLGGATAATTMVLDERIIGGLNMDGGFHGPDVLRGLPRSFMNVASQGHNGTVVPGWTAVWQKSHGWKREIEIKGTVHETFTDGPVLSEVLGLSTGGVFGAISAQRFETIQHAYLTAFFDFVLKGKKEELLDGPVKEFPEVSFHYI